MSNDYTTVDELVPPQNPDGSYDIEPEDPFGPGMPYWSYGGPGTYGGPTQCGAYRLPNGNTLITEGSSGRIIEVTPDHEIIWEYISPYYGLDGKSNHVYRTYRVPYEWVPQLEKPQETGVERIDKSRFRVPGRTTDYQG